MLRKPGLLVAALAACFLTVSAGTTLADGRGQRDGDWGRGRHVETHYFKDLGHRYQRHHARRHDVRKHRWARTHIVPRHRGGYVYSPRYIPWPLIHTHPPAYPGSVLSWRSRIVVQTLDRAPDNRGIVWSEPQSQTPYEIVPTKTYQQDDGRYCREYLTTATVGGQISEAYGVACRQPDGAWEIVQ